MLVTKCEMQMYIRHIISTCSTKPEAEAGLDFDRDRGSSEQQRPLPRPRRPRARNGPRHPRARRRPGPCELPFLAALPLPPPAGPGGAGGGGWWLVGTACAAWGTGLLGSWHSLAGSWRCFFG
jgi:hypothetical protein